MWTLVFVCPGLGHLAVGTLDTVNRDRDLDLGASARRVNRSGGESGAHAGGVCFQPREGEAV